MSLQDANACSLKCFATVSIKISPALDTPPPITNTCGLTTQAILDNAIPSVSPKISTASNARASPFFASSKISFAVSGSNPRKEDSASFSVKSFFAMRTIPVADAYCSKQPCLPHPQVSFSSVLTVICPISPPAPFAPGIILPL